MECESEYILFGEPEAAQGTHLQYCLLTDGSQIALPTLAPAQRVVVVSDTLELSLFFSLSTTEYYLVELLQTASPESQSQY